MCIHGLTGPSAAYLLYCDNTQTQTEIKNKQYILKEKDHKLSHIPYKKGYI